MIVELTKIELQVDCLWMLKGFNFGPGAMETAEDEWWVRMERAETIEYSVRASAPGASNPELMELMDTTSASIPSALLTSPTFPEKQSNLSDEEHCALTTVIKKKESLRCICCSADWIFYR
ncbi:hypothetical protein CDAR_30131 [Caerostris darwini]|uniref:Uncharacterized protein n=1 Tax=Caerostris darwini TaxID=1538125 RepID=A0AAV4Q4V9_9ARAC|nr:hypothetical protein CDAR_30131 [Caerostris darwini]